MKKLMILAATIAFASIAQARPDTTQMTCSEAADLVQAAGAIVMTYDHHDQAGPLYKRFVSNAFYCGGGEVAVAGWVKTTDSARCLVGKVCVERQGR